MTNHEKAIATYKALQKRKANRERQKDYQATSFKVERVLTTKKKQHFRRW